MTGAHPDISAIPLHRYDDALAYLYTLRTFGTKLGLERVRALLDALGAPDRVGDYLHIAGTNGKGSTAACLESILRAHGLKTGLFTSPHLVHFTERIRVNGAEVSPDQVLNVLRRVVAAATTLEGEPPTFFEIVTAMACCHFADMQCEAVVWETGMGGRLDATNAVNTRASIITPIGLDHTRWLGTTLAEIAGEKAGIIRPDTPVFTSEPKPGCLDVMAAHALQSHTTLYQVHRFGSGATPATGATDVFVYESYPCGRGRYAVSVPQINLHQALIGVPGRSQTANAALAAVVADWYLRATARVPEPRLMCAGLESVTWPARCEILSQEPVVILDCAHNAVSAAQLGEFMDEFNVDDWLLVFGALADKQVAGVLKPLAERAHEIWYLKPVSPRGLPAADFKQVADECDAAASVTHVCEDARELWRKLASSSASGRGVVIAGSCYLAGDVLAAREGLTRDIRVDDPHSDRQGQPQEGEQGP
jgi:dihydrofolate synthase/folylpolyglutamate synthase